MKMIWLLTTILILGLGVSGQAQPQKSMFDEFPKTPYAPGGLFSARLSPGDGKAEVLEEGAVNNIGYRIVYRDGVVFGGAFDSQERASGGKFEQILVGCAKDSMTDAVSCHMSFNGLLISYHGGSKYLVFGAGQVYPGSDLTVRLDARKPIVSREIITGVKAASLIEQMKTARKVTVRSQTWPDSYGKDSIFEPRGYSEALAFLIWAHGKVKKGQ